MLEIGIKTAAIRDLIGQDSYVHLVVTRLFPNAVLLFAFNQVSALEAEAGDVGVGPDLAFLVRACGELLQEDGRAMPGVCLARRS